MSGTPGRATAAAGPKAVRSRRAGIAPASGAGHESRPRRALALLAGAAAAGIAVLALGVSPALSAQDGHPPALRAGLQSPVPARLPAGLAAAASASIGGADRGLSPARDGLSLPAGGGGIGSTLIQQGPTLAGAGENGEGIFGYSVALSADGDTALIGGPDDNGRVGAAWVFTRSGSTWTQQGPKLTGSAESGDGEFGWSVALSADGDTALIGGPHDNGEVGAAWVFTRSGSTWTQQGPKLTGSAESGDGEFGWSVALSGDSDTALIGGPYDDGSGYTAEGYDAGAAWVFTRSGSTWTQQGPKLAPRGISAFGWSVSLSSDGDTALIGGPRWRGSGRAWVFTRSGSTWTQLGQSSPEPGRAERAASAQAWRCRPKATPP